MKYKFITIDILDASQQQRELNAFYSSHRVLNTSRELVQLGNRAYWAFCLEYDEAGVAAGDPFAGKKPIIDYKDVLAPEHFAVYSRLRELRKALAEEEDVPLYNLFTNAQLAEIAQNDVKSLDDLAKVKGFGEVRMRKFGERVLKCVQNGDERGQA
ncbi:MAG: HRDC domain-containing protein [Pirellulaceae bacterium]|nr:HRDC domain-containing protein [Pirellulaceae bacterium]